MEDILEVTNLHVMIEEAYVLQGISFRVPEGQLVAVLGRNGAGKTTTLESILGLNPPFKGEITFQREDITGLPPHQVAQKGIGYSPDSARIFSELTVRENLKMGMLRRESQPSLDEIYALFPFLKEHGDNLGKSLSGGEQKMLALARAMVDKTNDLLLIDEPTEGLSPENSQKVYEALEEAKERASILLVADNLELAKEFAEKYIIISTGVVKQRGEIKELIQNPDITDRYLGVGTQQESEIK